MKNNDYIFIFKILITNMHLITKKLKFELYHIKIGLILTYTGI